MIFILNQYHQSNFILDCLQVLDDSQVKPPPWHVTVDFPCHVWWHRRVHRTTGWIRPAEWWATDVQRIWVQKINLFHIAFYWPISFNIQYSHSLNCHRNIRGSSPWLVPKFWLVTGYPTISHFTPMIPLMWLDSSPHFPFWLAMD